MKIQRSQRMRGVVGNTVYFCLDVRAEYSPEERDNVRKYKLGPQIVYNSRRARKHFDRASDQFDRTQSRDLKEQFVRLARGAFSLALAKMSLNISIASLERGHHIECKDLDELLEAEDAVRDACKNVTRYLEIAATFDGSEVVIEYENGEERVHITEHAPPLLSYQDAVIDASPSNNLIENPPQTLGTELAGLQALWCAFETKLMDMAEGWGWMLEPIQVRVLCGAVALAVLVLVVEIF